MSKLEDTFKGHLSGAVSVFHFWKTRSFTGLEFTKWARLAGQQALGICLLTASPATGLQIHHYAWLS